MRRESMVGKRVICRIRSAYQTKTATGTIVQRRCNDNVFVLKLEHDLDFFNLTRYDFPKGSTILVAKTEIMK